MDLSDSSVRRRINRLLWEQRAGVKICNACFKVKRLTDFNVRSGVRDGRQLKCAACGIRTNRARYEEKREHCRKVNDAWRESNPAAYRANNRAQASRHRAIKRNATVESFTARDLRHDWEEYDLYECFFCGGSLVDGYEVEHFYALSKYGPHALFNLVPSCIPCNRGAGGKGTKEPWGYLREALAEQGVDLDAAIAILVSRERP
ncbi:hypothetical protein AQJ23_44840 [Streptomyces antibioticus]|nr:HNH endonuclease [Streptomyces antibioticus]KUN16524.1 hypothetical protein AQJ23_44840 [Streptomyces antibioticus]